LHQWEVSLMESTSFAQVFLHLNILHDCIQWRRSTNKSLCKVCRRGSDPEKMLLCDECNAGTHMFCLKPKLRSVPPGNWYCNDCVKSLGLSNGQNEKDKKQATKKKRKFIVEEEDDEATDEEEEEKKDDDMTDEDAEHENEKHDEDVEDDESVTSTPSSSRVNGRILRRPRTRPTSRRLTSKEIEEHAQEDVDSGDVSDDASLTAGEDTIEDES